MGRAALELARQGFYVFPLAGKVPLIGGGEGVKEATRDEEQIRKWWTAHPEANIGGAMGKPFEGGYIAAIDIDRRHDGERLFDAVEGPEHFETRTHRSGDNGRHLFYLTPEPTEGFVLAHNGKAKAVEVKGVGGYVVLPPSLHPDTGKAYEITDAGAVEDAPPWLYSKYLQWKLTQSERNEHAAIPMAKDHKRYAERLEKGRQFAREAPAAADGSGGHPLFNVCIWLVRKYELHNEDVFDIIEEEFNPRATDSEGRRWPWSEKEIAHKVEQARFHSHIPCGLDEDLRERVEAKLKEKGKPRSLRDLVDHPTPRTRRGTAAGDRGPEDRNHTTLTRDQVVAVLYRGKEWDDVLWRNVLTRRPFAVNPPIDAELSLERGNGLSTTDKALISHWFAARGENVSVQLVEESVAVVTAQRDRQKNPIADYLDALEPATDTRTLDTLAKDVLRSDDPLATVLIKKTLAAAALRARNPGAPHKGMLVLKGKQGCGKTPAIKILAGEHYETTGNGDITSDWTQLTCAGKWLVEVEELSAAKKDSDALKTAISRTHDTPNVKYERNPEPYPRSFVYIGTTNKESFLVDPSGDARYWVVRVGNVDREKLATLRDRIWAEADYLARTMPERWNFLTPEEEGDLAKHQHAFRKVDPFHEPLMKWLREKRPTHFDASYAWKDAKLEASNSVKTTPTPAEQDRIEACFQAMGCAKKARKEGTRPRIDGRRVSSWWELSEDFDHGEDEVPASRHNVTALDAKRKTGS